MGKSIVRDELVAVKLNQQEVELLDRLAMYYNMNRSELLRWLLAQQSAFIGFEIPERLKNDSST